MPVTHSQLVEAAAKWLQRKCSIVITEISTAGEEPDAIGWSGSASILVECKATKEDYSADLKKYFRTHAEMGIGQSRYYLSPQGVLNPHDIPLRWGILELCGQRIRLVRKSDLFEHNVRQEIRILISSLRRIGLAAPRGVSIRCYTFETKNRATIGISSDGDEMELV